MKVIDELAMLDEDVAMIACLDPDAIAAGAARFFETAIQRQDALLILPSATRPSGWQLHICPRFFETDAAVENPWLDFLRRRYPCQIHLEAVIDA